MSAPEIHHIGHAVADLDAAVTMYERVLGGVLEHRETMPDQGVEAATILVGSGRIELLRPLGDTVVLMPILTSTADEIDRIVATLGDAISEVCAES